MTAQSQPEFDEDQAWDHLILPADVKRQLQRAWLSIWDAISQKQANVRGPHILVSGPPGTGKTEITKVFSRIEGGQFIRVIGPDFRGSYIGQSSQRVQEIFSKARDRAPSILCIDFEQGPYSDF